MNDIVIEANGMTRYFGGKAAVEQVSFKVRTGEIFAMLGRNGAGKTTLIRRCSKSLFL
jgi:ABC-type multidrug transport system ATPase subunit